MTSFGRTILGVVLILVITFCGTFIVSKLTDRWGGVDLTSESVYTLSDGSKEIVQSLSRPLKVSLFYSKTEGDKTGSDMFRRLHHYYFYVRDLLRAYERASGGKLSVHEYDPVPFSDEEVEADRLGIERYPLTETAGFYFGLAVTSGAGAQEVMKSLVDTRPSEQAQLEYRISELIDLASRRKKTRVGLLSSITINGDDMSDYMRQMLQMQGRQVDEPWVAIQHMKRFYDVENVEADADEIDSTLDYLVVVHPKDLPDPTLYAIDQFVMRGGKLIAFVDPFCLLADHPPQQPNNPFGGANHDKSSDLNKLTRAWGVELAANEFAGDLRYADNVTLRTGQRVRFVGKMTFVGDALSQQEVVTSGLDDISMFTPGVLRTVEDAGTTVTPLITTSPQGNTWTASSFELGGPMGIDIQRLAQKFEPGVETLTLAARLSGTLKSAFPDGAPAADDAEAEDGEDAEPTVAEVDGHLAESREPNSVIVVADVDMLTDPAAFTQSFIGYAMANSNLAFLMNSLDYLAGSQALISIRARKQFSRPFHVIDAIEREADEKTRERVKEINEQLTKFDEELRELNQTATAENVGLKQSEAYEKQRKLQARQRELRHELRQVQKSKLDEIAGLGFRIKALNIFVIPTLVAVIGLLLFFVRINKRKAQLSGGAA